MIRKCRQFVKGFVEFFGILVAIGVVIKQKADSIESTSLIAEDSEPVKSVDRFGYTAVLWTRQVFFAITFLASTDADQGIGSMSIRNFVPFQLQNRGNDCSSQGR